MVEQCVPTWRLGLLGRALLNDAVIAYPTEGVWGLGCLPESDVAVSRILTLKQRSVGEGLLLVAASIDQVMPYLEGLDDRLMAALDEAWPGPTTFLVPDNGRAPAWIVGRHETLGIRVSTHPVVRSLCTAFGPLVSTSANISGHPPAMNALQIRQRLRPDIRDGVDFVVPGELGGASGPSQIKVLTTGEIIR